MSNEINNHKIEKILEISQEELSKINAERQAQLPQRKKLVSIQVENTQSREHLLYCISDYPGGIELVFGYDEKVPGLLSINVLYPEGQQYAIARLKGDYSLINIVWQ